RVDVLHRFRRDDELSVKAILSDLVESGLLFRSGREQATAYRAARADELRLGSVEQSDAALRDCAWVLLHQLGPMDASELAPMLSLETDAARQLLDALVAEQRARLDGSGGFL